MVRSKPRGSGYRGKNGDGIPRSTATYDRNAGPMSDQLVDFLRTKRERATSPAIDWTAKRDAWIGSVQRLYEFVKELLRDSIQSGDATLRPFEIEVTEEFIGTYTIPALELTVGNERVEFRPKGVTVIGAAGRVDIRGERGTLTLVKDKPDAERWSIVLERVPRLKTEPLDRKSFKLALERVMLPLP